MNEKKLISLASISALLFVIGMIFPASSAFAISCFNPDTGEWLEFPSLNECPNVGKLTSDPGMVPAGNHNAGDNTPDNLTGDNGGEITTLGGLISQLRKILNLITPFLVALGVFVIIFGVFKYLSSAGDEEKRAEARLFVVWGVIGVFAMVSIWGFVSILVNTFPLRKTPVQVNSIFPSGEDADAF